MTKNNKRILIITSCTGEKSVKPVNQLTLEDFQDGKAHVAKREAELEEFLAPAETLYTGLQHKRLMRGVEILRSDADFELNFWILSAGYGLIPANQKIAPYECTFSGMKVNEITDWSTQIGIPDAIQQLLATEYDLALVLLGDSYLRACGLDENLKLGGSAIFFTGLE